MSYAAKDIRNICLLGHGGTGKTSLVESMLFLTGATDRLGKVPDGNTVCDYDPEEIKRQISIYLTTVPVEYRGCKVNVIDTPGYFDFAGEVNAALQAADIGVITCSAKDGIAVGAEKAWKYLQERKLPAAFYVSKVDEDNSDFNTVFAALRERFGTSVCPVIVPIIGADKKACGVIDVANKKAYEVKGGKRNEIPVPADQQDMLEELYGILCESIAEVNEEYMEKFFSGEPFTAEEITNGLKTGVCDRMVYPVFCGSGVTGLGTLALLDGAVDIFPNPQAGIPHEAETADGKETKVEINPDGATCIFIYKTISDQYGKYSFFKVLSGRLTPDMTLLNPRTGNTEKVGHIYVMRGKKSSEVTEVCCGDIAAIAKLSEAKTGDTLCDAKNPVRVTSLKYPAPCYSMAIAPKTKGQEDKIAQGLVRLGEEDPTFTVVNNAETHQVVVSAMGDIQLDVLVSRLKSRFGVDAELSPARVAYREKIRKKVKVQGRHKKQSGGHGQFGDVWIEFEPGDEEELVFAENVFGGSVPKNFFPAVEKGLRESAQRGVLAGYPVVFLKATLVDGSYHPVDSSEMAFKTAASLAYKAGLVQANPVLLEPIGTLQVTIPDSYMGDVIGDLNKRRGRVMGMNPVGDGEQVVEAEVPMGEMGTYAIDLRSMTQGRGSFTFEFVRYEEAPPAAQQKAIEDAKALQEE